MAKEKPGDYKSKISKFETITDAYIKKIGDGKVTLDDLKKATEEMRALESEYSKIDSLKGKYRYCMSIAEAAIAVGESYDETTKTKKSSKTTKSRQSSAAKAEDIAKAVSDSIKPLLDKFTEVSEELSLTPLQKAKRDEEKIKNDYKDRLADAAGKGDYCEIERLNAQIDEETASAYQTYGFKWSRSKPEPPKKGRFKRLWNLELSGKKRKGDGK